MTAETAETPRRQVRVCTACGKREGIDRGWDVSCHIHGVWVWEDTIELGENGLVRKAEAVPVAEIRAK